MNARDCNSCSKVDRIFISHFHDPMDGFPNLEEAGSSGGVVDAVRSAELLRGDAGSTYQESMAGARIGVEVRYASACCTLY